ncbi:uncharacterized protein LOC118403190 [Branchiostoma floridae]|uniref:Uncharacterized protein LOC118403190 n=1 Tax=Branchiostoma floridae TaxID=7739 RepID=A0A9J7KFF1_BRAFL|nr:uncharacterized protein LOC118403190 [Branchiostoma floridae]
MPGHRKKTRRHLVLTLGKKGRRDRKRKRPGHGSQESGVSPTKRANVSSTRSEEERDAASGERAEAASLLSDPAGLGSEEESEAASDDRSQATSIEEETETASGDRAEASTV